MTKENYTFNTSEPLLTNEEALMYFYNDNLHFYKRFQKGATVIKETKEYIIVEDLDGIWYEVKVINNYTYSYELGFREVDEP